MSENIYSFKFLFGFGLAIASSIQVIRETIIENKTAVKKLFKAKPERA
jgi:hypothetical protein